MKTQKSFFEQNGGAYTRVGDVLLPNLSIGEEEQRSIGKYAQMRKRYLKEHRPVIYSVMLLDGTLFKHLADIDNAVQERIDLITAQLAAQRGITERLKAENQLRWVQEMNSIRASAEENVLSEIIYE